MTPAHRKTLILLLAAALVVRLAAGWAWQSRLDGRFGMGDSESYWALASAIAAGAPYEFGAERLQVFRTPGYPIVLAPILWLAGDNDVGVYLARAEAALLGMLAVLALWWLTRLLFDERTALLAAGIAAFYPGAIAMSILVLSEAPFCPLMLGQLALWTLAWRSRTRSKATMFAVFAGFAAGATTLMRPSWLLFTPLAAVVAVVLRPAQIEGEGSPPGVDYGRWRQVWIGAWMLAALCVAMLPWWIRNAYVTGRFVPTTLQIGASLYDGLSPSATGASDMEFVPTFVAQERQRDVWATEGGGASFEVRLDRRMRDESVTWAANNPARVAQLAWIKVFRMWNVWPNEPRLSSWPIRLAVVFTYTPLVIFAIIGVWRTLDRGWPYILCWLPAAYFTLLHMVFVSSIRYREPAMLALLALSAGAMMSWIRGRAAART